MTKKTWETLVPTHKSPNTSNQYAKFEGVWQCFYNGWETETKRSDKFFESMDYYPDDELIPLD